MTTPERCGHNCRYKYIKEVKSPHLNLFCCYICSICSKVDSSIEPKSSLSIAEIISSSLVDTYIPKPFSKSSTTTDI